MVEYLILGEENVGGLAVYRKLATTDRQELAEEIFRAILAGDAYNRVLLVEVKEAG